LHYVDTSILNGNIRNNFIAALNIRKMEEGVNPPRLPINEDSLLSADDSILSVDDKFANRYLTTASESDSDSDEISDSSVDSIVVPERRSILRKPFANNGVLIIEPDEIVFENVLPKKVCIY
jgi:hypothetical protein